MLGERVTKAYWLVRMWFSLEWWRYILRPREDRYISWLGTVWCRMRNHPKGVWYYNPGGWEPNMRCKNCGDDLE